MQVYGYIGDHVLGSEPLGTADKWIWRDLKTKHGAINRAMRLANGRSFTLYTFTNFYDSGTFKRFAVGYGKITKT